MASSIDASTSGAGGLIQTADNTGILQLKSGGTTIMTVGPTGVSTQVGSPAFRAYRNPDQSISSSTWTKVQFNNETFDTNSNYDSSTNYRFTPTVAGYYQINAVVRLRGTSSDNKSIAIYKNGTAVSIIDNYNIAIEYFSMSLSDVLYCNGSTDYIEVYGYTNGSNTAVSSSGTTAYFSASLARSA